LTADFPAAKACEELRISQAGLQDSQKFAALRKPQTTPQAQQRRGSSQDSQLSQGVPGTWTDADITRYLDRRARLLRWGWSEAEADRQAERLVMRGDDTRVSCIECKHHRPSRCLNHTAAGLLTADVGRDLSAQLHRCPAFTGAVQHKPLGAA
jgi:hypothetical protein